MSVLDPKEIRDGLGAFSPAATSLCTPPLQQYLAVYGLAPLLAHCRYSIGVERIGELSLVVQCFRPLTEPVGTAVVVHGYMDHAGLYRHLIDYLLGKNWQVLIHDLAGHGLSEGPALSVDHFSSYAKQLTALLERHRAELPGPWVLIGQSTGAAVLMEQQRLDGRAQSAWPVAGRVFLAPLVRPVNLQLIQRRYRWFGRFLKYVRRMYSENSHDPAFVRFLREEDSLQHPYIAVSWVRAMLEWIELIESSPSFGGAPLVIQGTEDGTVDWRHNLGVIERLYPGRQLALVDGARHHLVNEREDLRRKVLEPLGQLLVEIRRAA